MASLFFRDMKRIAFSSCSSTASTAVRRAAVPRSPAGRYLGHHVLNDSKHNKKARSSTSALVSPASSSRFLLGDVPAAATAAPFVDAFPEAMPMQGERRTRRDDDEAVIMRSCSTRTRDQVVVLRVSLHCKGCVGEVKKHISKMQGVTSFEVDLAKKKVTVVGDVTPLGVLSSVSRVKSAQLWPTSPPPRPPRASASF